DLRKLGAQGVFSPDGKTLVLNTGEECAVLDVATGKTMRTLAGTGSHLLAVALSPDARFLLTSALGKTRYTRLANGRVEATFPADHAVELWEFGSGRLGRRITLPGSRPGPVAISVDGRLFATADDQPNPLIRIYEVASGQEVRSIKAFGQRVLALAFSAD